MLPHGAKMWSFLALTAPLWGSTGSSRPYLPHGFGAPDKLLLKVKPAFKVLQEAGIVCRLGSDVSNMAPTGSDGLLRRWQEGYKVKNGVLGTSQSSWYFETIFTFPSADVHPRGKSSDKSSFLYSGHNFCAVFWRLFLSPKRKRKPLSDESAADLIGCNWPTSVSGPVHVTWTLNACWSAPEDRAIGRLVTTILSLPV